MIIRQVLEHIANLENFGLAIQRLVKLGGVIVIEVPDAELNFRGPDYALWEKHVNYFTISSLKIFLQLNGIELVDSFVSIFSGLCLTVLGRKIVKKCEVFSLEPNNDSISVDFF